MTLQVIGQTAVYRPLVPWPVKDNELPVIRAAEEAFNTATACSQILDNNIDINGNSIDPALTIEAENCFVATNTPDISFTGPTGAVLNGLPAVISFFRDIRGPQVERSSIATYQFRVLNVDIYGDSAEVDAAIKPEAYMTALRQGGNPNPGPPIFGPFFFGPEFFGGNPPPAPGTIFDPPIDFWFRNEAFARFECQRLPGNKWDCDVDMAILNFGVPPEPRH